MDQKSIELEQELQRLIKRVEELERRPIYIPVYPTPCPNPCNPSYPNYPQPWVTWTGQSTHTGMPQ